MGVWSAGITGNDTAEDLKSEYQAAFFYYDVETALQKLDEYVRAEGINESDEEEWCCYYYSLAEFMWKKGILTDEVRDKTLAMIDSGFGLDAWAESGKSVLNQRKKVLSAFREKLLSPQPPRKKIQIKLYMTPIFETGDLVAIQLKTLNKTYLTEKSQFDEDFFRACHDQWVVVRKVGDRISYTSSIVPEVRDIWPYFQLYGKLFEECPTEQQLADVPWAVFRHSDLGVFGCEGSMFYFRKRNYRVIGSSTVNLEQALADPNAVMDSVYFSINRYFSNADTDIMNAILEAEKIH